MVADTSSSSSSPTSVAVKQTKKVKKKPAKKKNVIKDLDSCQTSKDGSEDTNSSSIDDGSGGTPPKKKKNPKVTVKRRSQSPRPSQLRRTQSTKDTTRVTVKRRSQSPRPSQLRRTQSTKDTSRTVQPPMPRILKKHPSSNALTRPVIKKRDGSIKNTLIQPKTTGSNAQRQQVLLTPRRGTGMQRGNSVPILVGNRSTKMMTSSTNAMSTPSKFSATTTPPTVTGRRASLHSPQKSKSGGPVLQSMSSSTATTATANPVIDSRRDGLLQRNQSDPTSIQRMSLLPMADFMKPNHLQKISENKVYRRPKNEDDDNDDDKNSSESQDISMPKENGSNENVELENDGSGDNDMEGDDIKETDGPSNKKKKTKKKKTAAASATKNSTKKTKKKKSKKARSMSPGVISGQQEDGVGKRKITRAKSEDMTLLSDSVERKDEGRLFVRSKFGRSKSADIEMPTEPSQGILRNSSHHGRPTQGILRNSSHHGSRRPSMDRGPSRVSISIPVEFTDSVEVMRDSSHSSDDPDEEDIEEIPVNFEPKGTTGKRNHDLSTGNSRPAPPKPRPTLKRGLSIGSMNLSTHSLRSVRSQLSIDKELFEDDPRWKTVLRWLRILPPHKNENKLKRRIRIMTWIVLFLDFLAAMVAVTTYKGATTCCGTPIFSMIVDMNWDTAFRVLTALYLVLIFAEIIPVVRQGLPFNVLNPLLGFAITFAMFFDDSVAEALAMWIIEAMAVFFEFIVYRTRCKIFNGQAERIEKATQELQNIKKSQRMIVQSLHEASMHASNHSVDVLKGGTEEADDDDSSSGGSFAGNDSYNSLESLDDNNELDKNPIPGAADSLDHSHTDKIPGLPASRPQQNRSSLESQPSNRRTLIETQTSSRSGLPTNTPRSALSNQPRRDLTTIESGLPPNRRGIRPTNGSTGSNDELCTSTHSSGGMSILGSSSHTYHLPGEIRQNKLLRERRILRENQKKDSVELRLQLISTFFGVGLAIISLVLVIAIASTGGLCVADGVAKIFASDQLTKCNQCTDSTSDICEFCPDDGQPTQCYFPYY